MHKRLEILLLAVIMLSLGAIAYISKRNARLVDQINISLSAVEAAGRACVLPSQTMLVTGQGAISLSFPRKKAVMILAADKTCQYCKSALRDWATLARRVPQVDALLYDTSKSFTRRDLNAVSINMEQVVTSPFEDHVYSDLLNGTPSVVLIGRRGQVLGTWRGELSDSQISRIEKTIFALVL